MEKLVIDRSKWYRGKGGEDSRLLLADGQMCCLGFDLLRRGLQPQDIRGVGTPDQLNAEEDALAGLITVCEECGSSHYELSAVGEGLVDTNDLTTLDEPTREAKLTALFAEIGVDVEFVG